jgi:hypothetical protein
MEIETVQLWAFGRVNYNNYQLIGIVFFLFFPEFLTVSFNQTKLEFFSSFLKDVLLVKHIF